MSRIKASIKTAASCGMHFTGIDKMIGTLTGTSKIPTVVSYHRVVENHKESSRSAISSMLISTKMFEQHLDWIGRHYHFVSLAEIGGRMEFGNPYEKPCAAVSFDDGYRDVYDNAFPLLVKKGIPATVFVVTGLVNTLHMQLHDKLYLILKSAFQGAASSREVVRILREGGVVTPQLEAISRMRPDALSVMSALLNDVTQETADRMIRVLAACFNIEDRRYDEMSSLTWEMLKEMQAAGITIGSHTRSHALLTNETKVTMLEEAARSRQDIEQHLGVKTQQFAYPDGRHNADASAIVAAAGYRFAYGTCLQSDPKSPLMTIPRKVLWEKSSVDSDGRFSPSMMACQMNWVFDLGSTCTHNHGQRALNTVGPTK